MLTFLNKIDHEKGFIVRLKDHFKWKKSQCIVFEHLDKNLYDLLRESNFNGLTLDFVRTITWQVLVSLCLLNMPNVQIIHCDLKPENIMLRSQTKSGIKVIDFGSACHVNKKAYKYVQSRYYRAPEITMGLPYSTPIDVWSLGCIIYEMHFGIPLFKGDSDFGHLIEIFKEQKVLPSEGLLS